MMTFDKHTHTQQAGPSVDTNAAATQQGFLAPVNFAHDLAARQRSVRAGQLKLMLPSWLAASRLVALSIAILVVSGLSFAGWRVSASGVSGGLIAQLRNWDNSLRPNIGFGATTRSKDANNVRLVTPSTITTVAYYRLGEDDAGAVSGATGNSTTSGRDAVGLNAGLNLTRSGSPTYTSNVAATAASAVGSNLGVTFNAAGATLYSRSTPVTTATDNFGIEAWIKPATITGEQHYVANGNSGGDGYNIILWDGRYAAIYGGVTIIDTEETAANATVGVWTHVAVVRNNGLTQLYINGVAVGGTYSDTPDTPASGFAIAGNMQVGDRHHCDAAIDEVRVFTFPAGAFSPADLLINRGTALNSPPTITAGATATRQQGTAGSTATIATVSDDVTAAGALTVNATTVPAGITVTNIVNTNGTITATVAAGCSATPGNNTVVLTASDGTLTTTANFIVNVTANSAPTLTYANPAALVFGNGATVNPATGPSDNGSVAAIAVLSQGSFTGTVSVNNTTGVVTISNAAPIGTHTLTIRATDNCGMTTDAPFTVQVITLALGGKLADPLVCTGPGSVLNVTATVANPNPVTVNVDFSATPNVPGQLLVQAGSCLATGQLTGACSTTTTQVNFSGQLAAGQTITFTYRVQVADNVAPGAALCLNSTANLNGLPLAPIQACGTLNCPLAGPGAAYPASAGVSDQKPGSVLVFNLYSSGASNSIAQNTRINLTNTHAVLSTAVHLFFVDGASCSVADSYLCLTPNQTASFLASDIDPGTTGYLVAVAVDLTGCPRNFNYLIGDEYVKLSSGHAANLGAEAFAALSGGLPPCDGNSVTAELKFDGVSYNAAPLVLAADNIGSRADGNDTLLILNRLGGNLATSASTLTGVIGILYDDAESPFSFGLSGSTCQYRSIISGTTVRTTPRFEQITPAGRTGWFKVWMAGLFGMTGAILNANPNAATSAGAFNQGHNLHKLTTTNTVVLTIPVFPPSC